MKKSLLALLLFIFTLPVFAQNTILIVGDSISAGYGLDIDQGWVALLRARMAESYGEYRIINSSISGDTTSNGLARITKLLVENQPRLTIIELGGNDGLRGLPIATISSNLKAMITQAKDAGSQVLVLGLRLPSNYGPEYTKQFQDMYAGLVDKDVQVIALFLNHVDDQGTLMQQDRIHPNAKAQALLLDNVWPTLEADLKVLNSQSSIKSKTMPLLG